MKIRNLVFGCVMGIASAIAPMGAAQAVPLAVPDLKMQTNSGVQKAQVEFCVGYGCDRPRYYRRHHRPYYGYERRYYRPRYERPRYYGERHYERPRYYGGGRNAHVRWCMNRYRTYDPYTNRYHAGGGIYRACYSPYR
ncbi:MAG: BA14K family protein [Shinella sp.]|uniref:BA14K family protein n=1 Tax=Shinella sp. TaxID=1870904 RepID=UPI003C744E44